ncbi:MAG TPA: RNA polymerase sigma factor [Gemmataceae bacterium]|nr:RNA polymerase sigma factor [Gemmataceae bacterium]
MEHERDEYLMARVGRDQPELLEKLLRRHASPLLTFIQRMVGDHHRGEELFQEVFLALWIKRRQYQYPRPFKPWLYAIALNKCRAWFRNRSATTIPLTLEEASIDASPADVVIATETAGLVNRAIKQLPHQQRAVVVLRIWEGLTYAQIAEVVGCTEPTARSHMHHGLATLRKHLELRLNM